MAAAASQDIRNKLASIVECSVCFETFSDPRQLPCTHTFCLRCIRGFSKDQQPGENVSCPLCREEFKVPVSGVGGLPKNLFVEPMRDLVDRPPSIDCEVCSAGGSEVTRKTAATMFCVDCDERQCETCADNHSRMKISRGHKLIKMDEKDSEAVVRTTKIYCSSHRDKPLELYCFDCKTAICLMCSVLTHKPHRCADVNEVADEFRRQMASDVENMRQALNECRDMMNEEKKKQADFGSRVDALEREICDRVDRLKRSIDEEKANLVEELRSFKVERNKQIVHLIGEIEHRLSFMGSLVACTEQLREKGTASDVAQQTSTLRSRATELMTLDDLRRAVKDLGSIDITFTAVPWPSQFGGRQVGELRRNFESKTPTLTHAIPADGRNVSGVTCVHSELFVLRDPSKEEIQVYDIETFTQQRTVRVFGLSDAFFQRKALASCAVNNCLYACDCNNVFRVSLLTGFTKCWAVAANLIGLSVNAASHVVVTCIGDDTIREYTTNGKLIRMIQVQASNVAQLWHAVPLTDSLFVVSHHRPEKGGVSLIDEQGCVTATYRNGKSAMSLKSPRQLAVHGRKDSILATDSDNNRIVSLNTSLNSDLSAIIDCGLNDPWCIHFDELHNRLYVGEWSGQRVLIFDKVFVKSD